MNHAPDWVETLPGPWWADGAIVVAAFVLLFALSAFLRRRYRVRLARVVSASRSADAFAALSLREFQIVVGDAFRAQGYEVRELHGPDLEGGVDMELRRDGEFYIAQCTHWQTYKVPASAVRELYMEMDSRGASGAFLVTAGTFSEDARAFVQGTDVQLVDGGKLVELVGQR
ncbi:restriction endonuclease [Ramlibacter sp. PS4R-6]|uniref:restriction endonuclease n=1 Tax=Ramlibacter sp. PS4R-6 TaxID=3133438 RepID=UPI0030AB1F0D